MKKKILETKLTEEQIALFFLGQVGFIIKFRDKYILIDGYLSDYVDRNCSSPSTPWTRNYPAPITAEELEFIDYVFCTHAHADHADPDTLSAIAQVNSTAKFFVSTPLTDTLAKLGIPPERIVGLETDKDFTICDDISVTAIPSAHEELHFDENGNCIETGFVFKLGAKKIYHAGDCCPYEGLESRIAGCHILMLPINGRDWYRTNKMDIIGCFDSREAILLAKNVGAELLVPTHVGLYDINTVNPAIFVDYLYTINPNQSFHIFAPGEKYITD